MVAMVFGSGCQTNRSAVQLRPPEMPKRSITPSKELPGKTVQVREGTNTFSLFIPRDYQATAPLQLTLHFHGAAWFAMQEHVRAGLKNPLLCVQLGEGSSVYRRAFEDPSRLKRLIQETQAHLGIKPQRADAYQLQISSFSAGYGAVREIVKVPEYFQRIRRIVLCDSLYAGFESPQLKSPAEENIRPWIPFVRAAAGGKKTFVLTHSEVPTETYANTAACAQALIRAVGAPIETARPPHALEYPLKYRGDLGNFHVWGYQGTDAQAHMTHVRHLADVWQELNRVGKP